MLSRSTRNDRLHVRNNDKSIHIFVCYRCSLASSIEDTIINKQQIASIFQLLPAVDLITASVSKNA